jgi:hypothetical protein
LFERGRKRKRGCAPLRYPAIMGREFKRGLRPLSSELPSPAINILNAVGCLWLERGYRGEVGAGK